MADRHLPAPTTPSKEATKDDYRIPGFDSDHGPTLEPMNTSPDHTPPRAKSPAEPPTRATGPDDGKKPDTRL